MIGWRKARTFKDYLLRTKITDRDTKESKSDICQFFYQDLFHIVNAVYVQNFM